MKHIVWALALSLIVAACGKTNTTSSASGNSISSNPSTTTPTTTVSDFNTFKTRVANGDFAYPTYSYVNVYLKSFTTKTEKDKFLGIPYSYSNTSYSNMNRVDNRQTGQFQHELGANLASIKAALATLVNGATGTPTQCGQACWAFFNGTKTYMIDLNSPMVANPVASYENYSSSAGYSMLYWGGMP